MRYESTRGQRRILVAGGAGFLGSTLIRELIARGDSVVCVDNLSTGRAENVGDISGAFRFVEHDVCDSLIDDDRFGESFDAVLNAASPASPPAYFALAIETLRVGSVGTENLINVALRDGARFLQFSTSEVYGDPLVHPQPESYWGHVNPIGLRSMYDEAKRFGEALCVAHERTNGLDLRMVRIFNTYGPRMRADDGRVVTNLIHQALRGEPLTIYGDGTQTRSFCYVDDEVRGLIALLDSDQRGPVNLGNPTEFTMLELARVVLEVTGSASQIVFRDLPADDPTQRRPDISLARRSLDWEPTVALPEGIRRTVAWFRSQS